MAEESFFESEEFKKKGLASVKTERFLKDEPVILMHRILTRKEAAKRVKEIFDRWEKLGFSKPNDVPPEDKDLPEFLSIMRGLGYPEMTESYLEHLDELMGSKASQKLRKELGI